MKRFPIFACLLLLVAGGGSASESFVTIERTPRLGGGEDLTVNKTYIVQLRSPSVAEHHASTAKATMVTTASGSAKVAMPRLQKDSASVKAYVSRLKQEQQAVIAKVGQGADEIYSYQYGLNGMALRMSEGQAQKLRGLPEVLNVWEDEVRPLATRHSANFLDLFNGDSGLRTKHELDGDGIIIGVIDSGVAPENPGLRETRDADRPRACRSSWGETSLLGKWLCRRFDKLPQVLEFEEVEDWNGVCETGEGFDESACNNKLLGARWYIDGAEATGPIDENEFRSPRDADGHGTHTATTAAGNRTSASIFGTLIGDIEGIAPKARVAVYKACWLRPLDSRASCNTSDLARAIDDAVADGVDVISYSVGTSMLDVTAPDDVALMAAAKAGIVSVVAAGNDGPNFGTIGSPAGAPWVITAAASTRTGQSAVEAMEITAPASISGRYATREALFSPALSDNDPIESQLVLADDDDATLPSGDPGVTSDGCQPLVNSSEVSGKIALLQRSGCLFTDMVKNAEDAGAVAALVYNIAGDPFVMFGEDDVVGIPALMIGQADANLILAELDAGNEVDVTLEKSLLLTSSDTGNVMANFSSRGPGPNPDILKPDVTAPGVNIIAGFTPDPANATPGQNFAYLSGTSMSTPHIAGVAALLMQAHPDWSPAAIRSALITTARQDVTLPGSLSVPNPFDFGGGHIVPNDALTPGLVYDISDDEYDAFSCGIDSPAVTEDRCIELAAAGRSFESRDLNQPSIAVSRLASEETVTRHVTNPGDSAESYIVEIAPPPGILVTVDPPVLSVGPGETVPFDVTLQTDSALLDQWWFGSYTWVGDEHSVRSNIAVKPKSVSAPIEVSSVGGTGSETFSVLFGYDGSYNIGIHGLNAPEVTPGFVNRDPTKTFTRRADSGVTEHAIFVDPDQLFVRFSLFDAETDGDEDLDMYVFYCGIDGSFCTRVGESGEDTSEEQFNIFLPPAGWYGIYVHGFETDEVSGGPGSNYSLFSWQVGNVDDKGNMSASGPAIVAAGTSGDVTFDWGGLLPDTIYTGMLTHITPQGLSELTIVTIRN